MNKDKFFTNRYRVIAIALFCCLLWGSAFPVLKISYSELGFKSTDLIPKVVLAGLRFFGASLIIFFVYKVLMKRSLKVSRHQLLELAMLGCLQTSIMYFLFYTGLGNTTGMKGAILSASGNFFVVLLAHFVYHNDKINRNKTLGLLTGFAGITLVNWGKGFSMDFSIQGEGFLILSGFVGAFGTIIAKRLSKGLHPFLVSGMQMFIGSIVLLAVGTPLLAEGAMNFTFKIWVLLIYSSFLSATAFSLWYTLLKYNKAGEIVLYKFMIPVTGTFLSIAFIPGEKLTAYMVAGLVMVAIGIIIISLPKNEKLTNRIEHKR